MTTMSTIHIIFVIGYDLWRTMIYNYIFNDYADQNTKFWIWWRGINETDHNHTPISICESTMAYKHKISWLQPNI